MKVLTIKGLIEHDEMDIRDVVEWGDNYRKIATEYRFQGELVKRSVSVDGLRPIETVAQEGVLG